MWQVSREACERALQALSRQFSMLVKRYKAVGVQLVCVAAVSNVEQTVVHVASRHVAAAVREAELPGVTDVASLLRHVLLAGAKCLAGFLGSPHRREYLSAAGAVLGGGCEALSGVGCVVGWDEYVGVARQLVGDAGLSEEGAESLLEFMVSVGAMMCVRRGEGSGAVADRGGGGERVVVVKPAELVTALSAVMGHRYVGAWAHDAETTRVLAAGSRQEQAEIEEEQLVMQGVMRRAREEAERAVNAHGGERREVRMEELEADEAMFVGEYKLRRRFLDHVLLSEGRPRCGLKVCGGTVWRW